MKILFFIVIICSINFISCKPPHKLPKSTISAKEAYGMIHTYGMSKPDSILRHIRFRNMDLLALFDKKATVTFWPAWDNVKKETFIIVEYDEDPHSPDPAPVFFDGRAAFSLSICPPPNSPPCDSELESLF